jgi:hypothetical protein
MYTNTHEPGHMQNVHNTQNKTTTTITTAITIPVPWSKEFNKHGFARSGCFKVIDCQLKDSSVGLLGKSR